MIKYVIPLKIYTAAKGILARFRRDNLNEYAAYSALFIMLSFVPFIMILLNIIKSLPVFDGTAPQMAETAKSDIAAFFGQILDEARAKSNGAVISITTVAALWSASRGLIGIINGLNRIHRVREKRGFLRLRISAVFYMILFIAAVLAVLLLLVFGQAILERLEQLSPVFDGVSSALSSLRWITGFCLLVLFFLFVYSALPIHKGKPSSKLPGALFSAAGWLIFSGLYSVYVNNFANYSYVYGSLATVALLILWLYICMYILFLGEELNIMVDSGYIRKTINWIFKAIPRKDCM